MNIKLEHTNEIMETDTHNQTGESTEQGTPEPKKEAPLLRLRDLRPEKDPMGAGRKRAANPATNRFIR